MNRKASRYPPWVVAGSVSAAVVFLLSVHPGRFSEPYGDSTAEDVIDEAGILGALVPQEGLLGAEDSLLPPCPVGASPSYASPSPSLWRPSSCLPRHFSVLIVPLRDREDHFRRFLDFMHPFLRRQGLQYLILAVEQSRDGRPFNRAKLFNAGFLEARRALGGASFCAVFHDVDLLPQSPRNVYACTRRPRHLTASLDLFRYSLPYRDLFGGGVAMLAGDVEAVGGFSNLFFGWGGEDDHFSRRVRLAGLRPLRFAASVSRYKALRHDSQEKVAGGASTPSPSHLSLSAAEDGLKQTKYKILEDEKKPMYRHLVVQL